MGLIYILFVQNRLGFFFLLQSDVNKLLSLLSLRGYQELVDLGKGPITFCRINLDRLICRMHCQKKCQNYMKNVNWKVFFVLLPVSPAQQNPLLRTISICLCVELKKKKKRPLIHFPLV